LLWKNNCAVSTTNGEQIKEVNWKAKKINKFTVIRKYKRDTREDFLAFFLTIFMGNVL